MGEPQSCMFVVPPVPPLASNFTVYARDVHCATYVTSFDGIVAATVGNHPTNE